MPLLKVGPPDFSPRLIIFDKDGTLIDFHAMWSAWIIEFARRLESVITLPVADALYRAMGFDPASQRAVAGSPLAVWSMAALRELSMDVLCNSGLSRVQASDAVSAAWFVPDPIVLARPLADLHCIFSTIRAHSAQIAIATSDDRAATEATLRELGLASFLSAIVCADDHLPIKPAAEMVLHLCRALAIDPAQAVMVGDSVADMQMGRAAGVGLVVGVLSGVSSEAILAPHADVILASVADLVDSAI